MSLHRGCAYEVYGFQYRFELYAINTLVNANAGENNYIIYSTRTLESLCQELVEQGLLKQANNVRLQDYLGKTLYIVCVNWCAICQNCFCVLMIIIECEVLI